MRFRQVSCLVPAITLFLSLDEYERWVSDFAFQPMTGYIEAECDFKLKLFLTIYFPSPPNFCHFR